MRQLDVAVRYARLVASLTALDMKVRFAGSKLGIVWLALVPALTLGAYWVLFGRILRIQAHPALDSMNYGLLVVAGLLPWIGFSESMTRGTSSVLAQRNLMKSRVFPMELIPVTAVCSGVTGQVAGTVLLGAVLIATGKAGWPLLMLPLLVLLQVIFTVGLVWFLSCINIVYRDTSQVLSLILLLLMFVSPIAYTPDMMPRELTWLMAINPLSYLIDGYRDILVFGRLPPSSTLVACAGAALITGPAGYRYFMHLRRVLPDFV